MLTTTKIKAGLYQINFEYNQYILMRFGKAWVISDGDCYTAEDFDSKAQALANFAETGYVLGFED